MRGLFATLAVLSCLGGSASAQLFPRQHVPVTVTLIPDALDAAQTEFHEVANNTLVGAQRVRTRSAVRLNTEVFVRGATVGDAPIRIEAGAPLIVATETASGRDRFYCAVRRRPGLVPLQMWACLEDVDADSVFDHAGQANPAMGVVLPMPYSVFTLSPVNAPYTLLSSEEIPAYDIGINYRLQRRQIVFSVRARGVDGEWRDLAPANNYLRPVASVAIDSLPATAELFGMQIEVQSFDAGSRAIAARISRGIDEEGFALGVREVGVQ